MSEARARKIKLLLFDVDGVMTDGKLFLIPDQAGNQIEFKGYSAHDGLGISLARLGGLKTGLITKRESETVRLRGRDLKLDYVYQGAADKLAVFREILADAGLQPDEAAFVGDDIIDLPVLRNCGLAIAPANAREIVKKEVHLVTEHRGGDGAARDAIEYVLAAQGSLQRCMDEYISAGTPSSQKQQ